MNVKMGRLADTLGALIEFSNLNMPTPLALRVKRAVKVARAEVDSFVEVQKQKAAEFGAKIDGDSLDFGSKAKRELFNKEMEGARDAEITLPGEPFNEGELMSIKELKPSLLVDLDWFIDAP